MRVETIGLAQLYHGDCREILPALEPKADAVVTDPPYSDFTHKNAKTNKGVGQRVKPVGAWHGVEHIDFDAISPDEFCEAMRLCLSKSLGWVIATCDFRHAATVYGWKEFIRLGAWVKPNPMPSLNADRPSQGFETIVVLHSGDTRKKWNRGGGSGVWTFPTLNTQATVPTQKPIGLIEALLSDFTAPFDYVLDPFMGSGTTGVACANTSRKFIGIEANEERFKIACERIENSQRQERLIA